ncbi:MAG TPA: PLP-dependent aminotransferase family protein [Gemmatimonadaceae bacterium]|nr:PLP-dependent aminotransferase family protein [Gemmatimonadaceae bacterium]
MPPASFARRATQLSSVMPTSAPADAIAFDSGHAFPGVLPDLSSEAGDALSEYRAETLQYAPRPGLPELREWIADHMRADGASLNASNVLVTNGAKHALELVCRLTIDEGDAVVVTLPTYFSAIPIIRSFGATFVEVPQDANGMDVDALATVLDRAAAAGRAPKFIYNVPDFHNPTGVTMPLERRRALVDLARRYGVLLVEDSPYRKVRFEGDSVPSLKSLDADGSAVIQLGTFSKLLAPGLRVGWAAGASDLLARMAQLKTDAGSCPLTQRVILEFCRAGRLDAHTTRVQETYRAHRNRMVRAFERELPEVAFQAPNGGYYLWLSLPAGVDGDALARRAADAGVIVIAGSKFFANGGGDQRGRFIRVAFSHAGLDEIDEGVRRLASAYHSLGTGAAAGAAAN